MVSVQLVTFVTLGVIADLYRPEDTGFQYAVAFVISSSIGGAPIGTVIGGFVATYHKDPAWTIGTLLILGGVFQLIHFFLVPETNTLLLIDREAKKPPEAGESTVWVPDELKKMDSARRKLN